MPINTDSKIITLPEACAVRERLRQAGKTVVFTNGCFDLLHAGHVTYLTYARNQGDALFLGLNTDASVQRNKGPDRPIVPERYRAQLLAALAAVDYVVMFDEDEPINLIGTLLPDLLVKGEDWAHYVSGREIVERHGGRIILAPFVEGLSSTDIVQRILKTHDQGA
jgi:rfaE bifunctional protein nucleotidyltransferase chain/domain